MEDGRKLEKVAELVENALTSERYGAYQEAVEEVARLLELGPWRKS